MINLRQSASAAVVLMTIAACASAPEPRQELGAAEQAVAQARAAEAPQYAPAEFREARNKLSSAEAALSQRDHVRAYRLAEEARVDAELAAAIAENAKGKSVLEEVRENMDALRNQLRESPG